MDTKQKAIGALGKAAADLFWDLWQAKEHYKKPDNSGKMTISYLVDGENDIYLTTVYDKAGTADTPPAIKVILDVLRSCLSGDMLDAELIGKLESIINEQVKIQPVGIGRYSVPLKIGAILRTLADDVINYLVIMAENTDIDNFGFIGVCPGCNGVFFKRRKDQKHCASKCKLNSWNARKKAQAKAAVKKRK